MEQNEPFQEDINWNHVMYMLEKLTDVVIVLVEGEGDARSRLREASHLLLRVIPKMLPSTCEIRERVEKAYVTLTKFYNQEEYAARPKNSPETIYDSTIDRIRNRTGAKVIGELFGAWLDLRDLYYKHTGI